ERLTVGVHYGAAQHGRAAESKEARALGDPTGLRLDAHAEASGGHAQGRVALTWWRDEHLVVAGQEVDAEVALFAARERASGTAGEAWVFVRGIRATAPIAIAQLAGCAGHGEARNEGELGAREPGRFHVDALDYS